MRLHILHLPLIFSRISARATGMGDGYGQNTPKLAGFKPGM
ncbi:hypothetical protein HMPREF0577_0038 [Mobiluncus mulieris ATCC 35243]|nr:hypothetical protein HMPREF0577_0038 [Mobiluncus mulieris ATCC 35243]